MKVVYTKRRIVSGGRNRRAENILDGRKWSQSGLKPAHLPQLGTSTTLCGAIWVEEAEIIDFTLTRMCKICMGRARVVLRNGFAESVLGIPQPRYAELPSEPP